MQTKGSGVTGISDIYSIKLYQQQKKPVELSIFYNFGRLFNSEKRKNELKTHSSNA
jgi:hypothetical protein